MMYDKLYQYLLLYKELPVPGIGTFLLKRKSAVIDFPERKINPPLYSIALQPASHIPGKNFFSWLANALDVNEREAIFRFNDFAFDMKKQISDGAVIKWNGVGVLNKGFAGDIKLSVAEKELLAPVAAQKVIRDKAEHMVRVGEDQKTSVEMTEMLTQKEEKKSYWWAFALAVALVAVMFIGWYFSENGVDVSATANTRPLTPLDSGSTHRTLP